MKVEALPNYRPDCADCGCPMAGHFGDGADAGCWVDDCPCHGYRYPFELP